jgi:hypothetical protein
MLFKGQFSTAGDSARITFQCQFQCRKTSDTLLHRMISEWRTHTANCINAEYTSPLHTSFGFLPRAALRARMQKSCLRETYTSELSGGRGFRVVGQQRLFRYLLSGRSLRGWSGQISTVWMTHSCLQLHPTVVFQRAASNMEPRIGRCQQESQLVTHK